MKIYVKKSITQRHKKLWALRFECAIFNKHGKFEGAKSFSCTHLEKMRLEEHSLNLFKILINHLNFYAVKGKWFCDINDKRFTSFTVYNLKEKLILNFKSGELFDE